MLVWPGSFRKPGANEGLASEGADANEGLAPGGGLALTGPYKTWVASDKSRAKRYPVEISVTDPFVSLPVQTGSVLLQ